MEARVFSYDSKPCDGWAAMQEVLDHTTLLLVAQIGPTVFNIRDEQGRCWKVTIGNPHRCSCYTQEQFCIHMLYVILKVLQVPPTNPLAWQRSYTDADIDQVLAGRTRQMERRVGVRRTQSKQRGGAQPAKVVRHLVEEDKICPICQDEFEGEQNVSWCKTGCGNNMHITCMITYAEYKVTSNTPVTCPLCRDNWGPTVVHALKHDLRAGRSAIKLATPRCRGCRSQIRSKFYRCLDCTSPELPFDIDALTATDEAAEAAGKQKKPTWSPTELPFDICESCYNRAQRPGTCSQRHTFLSCDASASCWEFRWEAIAQPQQISPRQVEELQLREFTADDYQRLLELCERATPPPLHNYLVEWLQEGPELTTKCNMCTSGDSPTMSTTRKLACGHCVHHHCLLNAVTVHHGLNPQGMDLLSCAQCNNPLFSALTRRPVVRKSSSTERPQTVGFGGDTEVRGVALGRSHSFVSPGLRDLNALREVLDDSHRRRRESDGRLPHLSSLQPLVIGRPVPLAEQRPQLQSAPIAERHPRALRTQPPRQLTPFRLRQLRPERTRSLRTSRADLRTFELQGVQLHQRAVSEPEL